MPFHRVPTILVAVAVSAILSGSLHGQTKPDDKGAEKVRFSKAQMSQFQSLVGLVDAVIAGKESDPGDVKLSFHPHFIRSATNVFVPYMLEISGGRFTSFPVAMYVRAVRKGAAAAEEPAFTDIHFIASAKDLTDGGANTLQFARAVELPPGDFDLYVAMAETPPRNAKTPPKRVVHSTQVTVPNFSGGELTTSSIVLARNLEEGSSQLTALQQLEQPFTIGGQKITPTFSPQFSKSGELLFVFLIYNQGGTPAGKPDIDVTYMMFRAAEDKPFAKMPTTSFNATTLPAEFNLTAGHQVLVAQGVPLATFAPGDYRLALGITDKTTSTTITRDVPFTVTP